MKIAIIGYGKMGKEIEKAALERGHEITLKISSENTHDFTFDNLKLVDVAIEFTNPTLAVNNINVCLDANTPVVVGTTGWYADFEKIKNKVIEENGSLLHATNCSIGVNIFFKVNELLAKLMNKQPAYKVEVEEIHHKQKLDAPSGTAITITAQAYPIVIGGGGAADNSPPFGPGSDGGDSTFSTITSTGGGGGGGYNQGGYMQPRQPATAGQDPYSYYGAVQPRYGGCNYMPRTANFSSFGK